MTIVESPHRLHAIVASFAGRRILVLGDAILDEYLTGECSRISPEAPVPVVRVRGVRRVLGGAANTAANLAALGGRATLVSLVGDDETGAALARCAREADVDLYPVRTGMPTLRKTRVVGQHQQIVRLDYEEPSPLDTAADQAILERVDALVDDCDIVVMSDYAKGFFSEASAQAVIARAHAAGRLIIVDPRPEHHAFYRGCDYITPNWREARGLLGLPDGEPSPAAVRTVRSALAAALGANVVLTLGPGGISFCSRTGDEEFSMPTLAREVFDVSGAGDTVVATLALALVSGADHVAALELANKAASVVVAKFGTATLTAEELLGESDGLRLLPLRAVQTVAATLRAKGKRLVAVTGAFERLGADQVWLLNDARRKGDVLFVGLTSRAPERDRVEVLLGLRAVDYVHILDRPDATDFIDVLKPDVHLNARWVADRVGSASVEST